MSRSRGRRGRGPGAVVPGLVSSFLAWVFLAASSVLAADPTASPATGDVRTTATAPGLVGDPLFALVGVVAIGLLAMGATLLYVRLSSRP